MTNTQTETDINELLLRRAIESHQVIYEGDRVVCTIPKSVAMQNLPQIDKFLIRYGSDWVDRFGYGSVEDE